MLDHYGDVNRFVLTGRLKGDTARGTIRSYRYMDTDNSIDGIGRVKCKQSTRWKSRRRQVVKDSAPLAYFDVVPYRYRVKVVALKIRGRKLIRRGPSPVMEVYLPGEDGDWIRIR